MTGLAIVVLICTAALPGRPHRAVRLATDEQSNAAPLAASSGDSLATVRAASGSPNIVLFLTDDQRWDMLGRMPNVRRLLVDHGVRFANGFVVNSFCCPSRGTLLTGEYSHSTGVYTTGGPYGGYAAFHDQSTVATWLHGAGYHTALFGKYLNGYVGTRIPPGWDRWLAFQQNSRADYYYDYRANDQRIVRSFGSAPQDYSTNLISAGAVRFIHRTPGPLFLYLAPYAPHAPATPAPGDVSAFSRLTPARPASYDEVDVSDKPAWVRALPRMSPSQQALTDALRVNRFRSLLAVDRMVGQVVDAMADTGRLHDTMFVFTSDNGLAWGEHRWANRKEAAYEESIRVPFVVRYDQLVAAPRIDRHMVLNLDVAPTFAGLAGLAAPDAEGQSLLPLLTTAAVPWRTDFLIEHLGLTGLPDPPTFCAVRTTRYLYVEYQTGEEELYDLRADPSELTNAVADPALAPTLDALRFRVRDLCDPAPPGFTFSH